MKIHGTAKGGALGKKDFGVAFSSAGGGAPCVEADYDWADCGSDNPLTISDGGQGAGAWIRNGDLIGAKIKTLTQKMYRHESASGNMICHQINSGDTGTIKSTSDIIAISEISSTSTSYGSATSITFTFDDPAEIAENDCFIVSSDGSAFKLWASSGNCDSSDTNVMESDDASPPSFTEKTTLTARGSAVYCEA